MIFSSSILKPISSYIIYLRVTGNFKMTLNLNNYHLAVLEYVDSKGDADLNEISHDLHHDIPKHSMHDTLNYMLAKDLLVKVDEEHPGLVYKLSDRAKQYLVSLRQNAYKQQQRQNLEVENLRLQNEAMQHQATLRRQEAQIRSLTETNLRLQNINLKRTIWIVLITASVTFIAANWQWLLQLTRQFFQK